MKLCNLCSNQAETDENYCSTCLLDTFRGMVIKVYEAVGLRSDVCREINQLNTRIDELEAENRKLKYGNEPTSESESNK